MLLFLGKPLELMPKLAISKMDHYLLKLIYSLSSMQRLPLNAKHPMDSAGPQYSKQLPPRHIKLMLMPSLPPELKVMLQV
jgi:hypothetical protein